MLWGERHGAALLFWCECSRSWGKWGVCGGSCLRRNDGMGRRNDGGAWAIEVCRAGGGGSRRSTPHLTSPLEGGRDEFFLGGGRVLGRVGSCLRRNDGGAGMMGRVGDRGVQGRRWRLGAFHPPPNLPPERGEE